MQNNGATNGEVVANPLTPEEQAILTELQECFDAGHEEIPEEFYERMKRTLIWSWDDPASIERSLYFMAHDPYYRRESRAIEEDFARLTLRSLEEEKR